ncbi:MAG: Asp23/Gls24 family envelope stress response protein [Armatimonadetes bacterium]|nr:Asp23/Gls24 family envelope stress response protein [Armatimonadota bacterium]
MSMSEGGNLPAVPDATTLESDRGRTTIANGVVSKIAALAAREVEGVRQLVSMHLGQAVAAGLARMTRQESRDTGVSVEVGAREAAVDVRISADYGVSIPDLATAVRQNVIHRVESMTGLKVKEVNVAVLDLYFPSEEPAPEPAPRRVE